MRLTKDHRKAFVRGVMADVPKVDLSEQVEKLVKDDMRAVLPTQIVALMGSAKLRHYLHWVSYSPTITVDPYLPEGYSFCHTSNRYNLSRSISVVRGYEPGTEMQMKVEAMLRKEFEAVKARIALREKLEAAINGCATRKAALAMFPEFEKYLPAGDAPATKNLPVAANIVADLTKLGWPKGGVTA